jgi:hypothetical protein
MMPSREDQALINTGAFGPIPVIGRRAQATVRA